jgi:hypothetical protein
VVHEARQAPTDKQTGECADNAGKCPALRNPAQLKNGQLNTGSQETYRFVGAIITNGNRAGSL